MTAFRDARRNMWRRLCATILFCPPPSCYDVPFFVSFGMGGWRPPGFPQSFPNELAGGYLEMACGQACIFLPTGATICGVDALLFSRMAWGSHMVAPLHLGGRSRLDAFVFGSSDWITHIGTDPTIHNSHNSELCTKSTLP